MTRIEALRLVLEVARTTEDKVRDLAFSQALEALDKMDDDLIQDEYWCEEIEGTMSLEESEA